MNKELEQIYSAIKQLEDLGLPISKDQRKRMEEAEVHYVSNELAPSIQTVAKPLLSGLHCPVTLIVDYDPAVGIIVKTTNRKVGRVGRKPREYGKTLEEPIGVNETSGSVDDEEVILTHPVDWSPFEYGFTIDHKFHEAVFQAVGHYIERGTGVDVKLIFAGEIYDAKITNANRQVKGDTIRLLYRGKSNTLGSRLKKELPNVYDYIKSYKELHGGRAQCPIPTDLRRLLFMSKTEENHVYKVECKAC